MKQCNTCGEFKALTEYHIDKTCADGKQGKCKECSQHSRNVPEALAKRIYRSQVLSSVRRGHVMPAYTIDELTDWLLNNIDYLRMHQEWKISGYIRELAPSVDRENDYEPYSFDNIRGVITWADNKARYHEDAKAGINKKLSQAIIYEGQEYVSISAASRATGLNRQFIAKHGTYI